jgi:RNA ligase (TIGR02306 family)
MQHKLPERYRGHTGWLPADIERTYKPMLVEQSIDRVERIPSSKSGCTVRHDIETTTGNYFANGVLVHNSNCRVGIVNDVFCAGSRTTRKDPEIDRIGSLFWKVAEDVNVNSLLRYVKREMEAKVVIVFGEIYGQGVQSLHYGFTGKRKGFRAFDIYVDGNWLDYDAFESACTINGVPMAPVLYRGPFDLAKIKEVSVGKTTLPLANNIREGVVVRTTKERRDPAWGRMVMKFVSPDYDLSKHKKKDTTDL